MPSRVLVGKVCPALIATVGLSSLLEDLLAL